MVFIESEFNESLMFYFYTASFGTKKDEIIIPVLLLVVVVIPNISMVSVLPKFSTLFILKYMFIIIRYVFVFERSYLQEKLKLK